MKAFSLQWKNLAGVAVCGVLLASLFMHWAWYPDLQKHFTGFFSEANKYGKPGKLLAIIAVLGMLCFVFRYPTLKVVNLFLAGLGVGYGLSRFYIYTLSYRGISPEPQAGIYLMAGSLLAYLLLAILELNGNRRSTPPAA